MVELIYDRQPIQSMETCLCMNMLIFIAENRQNGNSHGVIAAALYTQDDTGFFLRGRCGSGGWDGACQGLLPFKSCWLFVIRMHIFKKWTLYSGYLFTLYRRFRINEAMCMCCGS